MTLKRVTGLSLVPTFNGGSGNVHQAGPSQENVKMRPIGSKQSINNAGTVLVFH